MELSVKVFLSRVPDTAGSQFVSVSAAGAWTLEIVYGDGEKGWASLEKSAGTGSESGITLSWTKNGGAERSCQLRVTSGNKSASSGTMTQEAGEKTDPDPVPGGRLFKSDAVQPWMELPATNNDKLYFITHPMKCSDGTTCRNYSFYWDPEALVAHWVAYPQNRGLLAGSSNGNSNWSYDPKVPSKYQPCLYSGYANYDVYHFDRGHQIPNADRNVRDANEQTYYFTNMTPQLNGFNSKIWASLEGQVRSWANSFDTLYVATGCVIAGSTQKAYDNNGKEVTVPTGYFKALLGLKKSGTVGNTLAQGGYTAVAFYFPHQANNGNYMDNAMTVKELEQKTGMDFFVNLPSAVGAETAAKIESTKDTYWWR